MVQHSLVGSTTVDYTVDYMVDSEEGSSNIRILKTVQASLNYLSSGLRGTCNRIQSATALDPRQDLANQMVRLAQCDHKALHVELNWKNNLETPARIGSTN